MFFVAARIKDRDRAPTYGVVEWGLISPFNHDEFRKAIALNYGGSPKDYFLFTLSDFDERSIRATKERNDFYPIWRGRKIVGLEFVPPAPLPSKLTRYQILLHQHIPHRETGQCATCGIFLK